MSCLPKPLLRGHAARFRAKTLTGALIVATAASIAYYLMVGVPRKKAYENFVKTYDPDAHYAELVKYGLVFSSKKKEED